MRARSASDSNWPTSNGFGGIFSKTEAELAATDAELFPFFQAGSEHAPAAVSPPPRRLGAWHARAQYFSMGRRYDYSDALAEITAPTLVVHGGNDLQPIEVASDYAAWIPNSSVVTIQGSGHFPHYTHGDALAPKVREFLDGLAAEVPAR